jgi:hypothetical protein
MAKVWVLDTETKGTGARMVPLEDVLAKPEPAPAPARRKTQRGPSERAPRRAPAAPRPPAERAATPLPPGHVRKKATGEIGRVRSVDPAAGTATVHWLKQGRTSTVPIAAISRR